MKKIFLLTAVLSLFASGCISIGNGIPVEKNYALPQIPDVISIDGAWRVEIICNAAENSCRIILDDNLQDKYSVSVGKKLKVSLPDCIRPMSAPILKIKTVKTFSELSLDGNLICYVKGVDAERDMEIELDGYAVCVFDDGKAKKIEANVSDFAKLTLKCKAQLIDAELDRRAVLDVAEVDDLHLDLSDNAASRIGKCKNAAVEASDNSFVEFKSVSSLLEDVSGNAAVKYPIVVPEELRRKKDKR